MSQPNILLIHSDQHRFDSLGINGHPLVRTPNLDRLAREGVNYTHAFTPTPICSPARASLLTGMWPSQHRCLSIPVTETYRPAPSGTATFSELLAGAGYKCGWVGKFHQELAEPPTELGFHDFVPLGNYGPWRAEQGLPPVPRANGWFGEVDTAIAPEHSRLAWGADHTMRLMRQYVKDDKKPFFLRWDPVEPHLPCIPPEPYASMYPVGAIPPWPSFPDSLADKPWIQAQQKRTWKVDGWSWKQWAPVVSRYLAEISLLDAQVGQILETLRKLRILDNTLVVYTTDHGDLCGGHGMMDKHFILYDDVVRVPFIARFPGRLSAGTACDGFVSNEIDLASTFLDVAGIARPTTFAGHNILDIANAVPAVQRADIYASWSGGQFGSYTQRMVRDRRWKYIWNATDVDELYDLEQDPAELTNLAHIPAHAGELQRLRTRLVEWMTELKDPMCNSWTRAMLLEGNMT